MNMIMGLFFGVILKMEILQTPLILQMYVPVPVLISALCIIILFSFSFSLSFFSVFWLISV